MLLAEVLWEEEANPDPMKCVYMSVRVNYCPFCGGEFKVVLIKRWCRVKHLKQRLQSIPQGAWGKDGPLGWS